MTRAIDQYVSIEMVLLGLLELSLLFLLIHLVLTAALSAPPGVTSAAVGSSINLAATLALTVAGTAATIGLYRPEVCLDRRRLLANAAVAGVLTVPAVVLVGGGFDLRPTGPEVAWLALLLTAWLLAMLLIRLGFSLFLHPSRFARRILVLAPPARTAAICSHLRSYRFRLFEPVPLGTDLAELRAERLRAQRIWGVIIAGTDHERYAAALLDSKLRGIRVYSETGFHEHQLGRLDPGAIDRSWLLCADGFIASPLGGVVKRATDILASASLLLLTLPLLVATAVLIKLDSPGPVFYRQVRTGQFGRPFTLFKFRSMRAGAEPGGRPRWALRHDPRITRIGGCIRGTRIDELPQLLNVLRGDMSMVGPRPERPHFVEQLMRAIPFYRERSYVRPGLTGWAQVNFPYGASIEDAREKLAYDLYYVKNRSLLLDLRILFATVRVILFREGAR